MSVSTTPRVFISHGSEDKAAHAAPLARALLARGVDVWLDEWEIGPGDSLVQKIFEHGLAGAQGMVVVLSETSVAKPWVRAELDVAVVRRIEGSLRLMPVLVDDCHVPESLRATLWMDMRRDGVEKVADRVAAAMFGISAKPPLGPTPDYIKAGRMQVPGLSPIDAAVLQVLYEEALKGHYGLIQPYAFTDELEARGVGRDALMESLDILVTNGYLRSKHHNPREGHFVVAMPPQILLQLAAKQGADVDATKVAVAGLILNEGVDDLDELVARIDAGKGLIDAILVGFQTVGFVRLGRTIQHTSIYSDSPSFRRWLAEK